MPSDPRRTAESRAIHLGGLAARAAHLHHAEGWTNIQIADELGVGRLRVPKLLEHAEATGIVRVEINTPTGYDAERSNRVRSDHALSEVLVPTASGSAAVGQLLARYLREVLVSSGTMGMSWGASVEQVVAGMEGMGGFPRIDAVQLIGGIPAVEDSLHVSGLLRRVAVLTGGAAFVLHAPMVVPTAVTAVGLRAEESAAHTFAAMKTLDVAVVGVGSWNPPLSRVLRELSAADRARGQEQQVLADVCGVFLDAAGEVVALDVSERMISITTDELAAAPVRVAIATGAAKVGSLKAALRSGLINVLATDAVTADALSAAGPG